MSSAKWRLFCLDLNVLNQYLSPETRTSSHNKELRCSHHIIAVSSKASGHSWRLVGIRYAGGGSYLRSNLAAVTLYYVYVTSKWNMRRISWHGCFCRIKRSSLGRRTVTFWSDIYESWEENKYHKNKYWRIFMLEIFLKGQIPRTQTGHTEIMSISRRPDNVG